MPIVRSFGALQSLSDNGPTWFTSGGGSLNLYDRSQVYADIYRTQPNVRICVDFLARNVAQLGLPVYRRISDTDRERLSDHDLGTWLAHPNPGTTRYRLIEDLMTDLGIYFRAYWLKVRYVTEENKKAIGLVRLPPDEVQVEGRLIPKSFCWTVDGREKEFSPSEIVHFSGYMLGISPLETLRRILAEESAAGSHRESYWLNAGRMEAVITQEPTGPNYTPEQLGRLREQLHEHSVRGNKVGMTPILPKGLDIKPMSYSAKDSEYIQGGKLRREIVAAAYHIPQPMVGILEHATFSNIKEQHKHTYQDCLGPWLEMISQEIERQLLTECLDQNAVYIEFNIDAKLAGTPEERAYSMQMSVGRPWRTVNEARALENLPRINEPQLDTVAPQQGGPAGATPPNMDDQQATAIEQVLTSARARQTARLSKLEASERPEAFAASLARWNHEVSADLAPIVGAEQAESYALVSHAQLLAVLKAEAEDA